MERECYIPLSPAECDRSRRIWVQAWHRYRRRRFICWVLGHAWEFRVHTDEVWPRHQEHTRAVCGRCWKTRVLR